MAAHPVEHMICASSWVAGSVEKAELAMRLQFEKDFPLPEGMEWTGEEYMCKANKPMAEAMSRMLLAYVAGCLGVYRAYVPDGPLHVGHLCVAAYLQKEGE